MFSCEPFSFPSSVKFAQSKKFEVFSAFISHSIVLFYVQKKKKKMTEEANANNQKTFQCVICLDENVPVDQELILPCCGKNSATNHDHQQHQHRHIRYCSECIWILASQNRLKFMRCPTCRKHIKISREVQAEKNPKKSNNKSEDDNNDDDANEKTKRTVTRATLLGDERRCIMCNQTRILVNRHCCEACNLGQRFQLIYECDKCHRHQMIPHPMWRYQQDANSFSGASWACHGNCGDYTHWRVLPSEIEKIPLFDIPESWGIVTRDDLLRLMRRETQGARGGNADDNENNNNNNNNNTVNNNNNTHNNINNNVNVNNDQQQNFGMIGMIWRTVEQNPVATMIWILIIAKIIHEMVYGR